MILVHPFQTAAERPPVRIALFGVSNGHAHTQCICGVRFKEGFVEYLFIVEGRFSCGVTFAKNVCGASFFLRRAFSVVV